MKRKPRPEGWNLALEVLATLPVEPDGARLADLAKDFGYLNQAPIRKALKELRQQGYAVRIWPGGNGVGLLVCIRGRSWGVAQVAVEDYWHKVYDSMDPERQIATVAVGGSQ